jgi:uncharacterized membrane protein (DUF485 family)
VALFTYRVMHVYVDVHGINSCAYYSSGQKVEKDWRAAHNMAERLRSLKESLERIGPEERRILTYFWTCFLVTYAGFGFVFAFQLGPTLWLGSPLATAVICLGLAAVLIMFDLVAKSG